MEDATQAEKARWSTLAATRLFLAMAVIATHSIIFMEDRPRWLTLISDLGPFTAVFGFLVVSGYSIAHSITTQPKGFLSRRVDRLYPVYFTAMVLAMVPWLIWGTAVPNDMYDVHTPKSAGQLIGNFFMLQGWTTTQLTTNAVTWSLGVEVACYALAPLLAKMRSRWLFALMAASACVFWFRCPVLYKAMYGLPLAACACWWLLGFLFYRHRSDIRFHIFAVLAGLLMVSRYGENGYSSFTITVVALVMIYGSQLRLPKKLVKAMNWCGDLSYPAYISHWPILVLTTSALPHRPALFYIAVVFVGSVAMLYLVDLPYRRYARSRRIEKPLVVAIPAEAVAETVSVSSVSLT